MGSPATPSFHCDLFDTEAVARTLLKNVDIKEEYHCNMKFYTAQELADHFLTCGFRPLNCTNEGCMSIFCASQLEKHNLSCPFKLIPCEQKCLESLMRRDMDKHCATVCPMKLVNYPFYAAGCESSIPHCMIEKHCLDDFRSHVLCIIQGIHKGVSVEDLKKRVQQLEDLSPPGRLAEAQNSRSLTNAVKDLETKAEPLEITTTNKDVEKEDRETKVSENSSEITPKKKNRSMAMKHTVMFL